MGMEFRMKSAYVPALVACAQFHLSRVFLRNRKGERASKQMALYKFNDNTLVMKGRCFLRAWVVAGL